MKSWQSLRWSLCGQAFFDGRGRTQVYEWRALMSGGNIYFTGGTAQISTPMW